MTNIFKVTPDDVSALSPMDLTNLLNHLLHLEASAFGIPPTSISVGANINAPDGGEDGRIQWSGAPNRTDCIPSKLVQFQVKATDMNPSECAKELVDSNGNLKPMINDALNNGATYILFNSRKLDNQAIQRRITSMRNKLSSLNFTNANNCHIDVYGSEKIADWVNKFIPAIVYVQSKIGRSTVPGLKTYDEWQEIVSTEMSYVVDQKRDGQTQEITNALNNSREVVRIIGTSGLGKTRMALEACRSINETNHSVVYFDASEGNQNLAGIVNEWIRNNLSGILVVDNCELHFHQRLSQEIKRERSKVSLLTMHYSHARGNDNKLIELSQMEDDAIKEMLEQKYKNRIQDIDRIVDFSKGFPEMAVALANARLDEVDVQDNIALEDDVLIKKMLWPDGNVDDDKREILQACSLFQLFGFDGDVRDEAKIIATEIAEVSINELHSCIVEFKKKGIINTYGRYVQIVPIPLAVRLAADWWKQASPEAQTGLIKLDMPESLQVSFCNQIEMLNFLPNVIEFTANLCGRNTGPFGQAEVILSEMGSRYFRSLAVVNPNATCSALTNVFSNLSEGEFEQIDGEARRNLVIALERLCFHKETFNEAIANLYYLASEENESWANNATGLFVQLYQPFLSGTEADLNTRIQYIDNLLNQNEFNEQLVVDALGKALDTTGFMRWGGAESRGSGKPLEDYHPSNQEIMDYWSACIIRLKQLSLKGNGNAKQTLAGNIRNMVIDPSMLNEYDNALKDIVDKQGPLWIEATDSIWDTLQYDIENLPEESVATIKSWVDLLQPKNIEDRLELIVSKPGYHHEEDDNGDFIDVSGNKAIDLAKELANPFQLDKSHIEQLMKGDQRQAYIFGKCIYQETENKEQLLNTVLDVLTNPECGNADLFYGILNAIYESSADQWEDMVSCLQQNSYAKYYVRATITGKITDEQLDIILNLRLENHIDVNHVASLCYGSVVDHISPSRISDFSINISNISQDDAWIALSIMCSFCYGRLEMWNEVSDAAKIILPKLILDKDNSNVRDGHNWQVAALNLVSTDFRFSKILCETILKSVDNLDMNYQRHYIPSVLGKIFNIHGSKVWHVFEEALENSNALTKYKVQQLFDRDRYGISDNKPSLLLKLPVNVLKNWCNRQPDIAPKILGRIVEVYQEDKSNLFSDWVHYLLDNYGSQKEVLNEISSNMGSFSSMGSRVKYYKQQKQALSTVANHAITEVRDWVRYRSSYLDKRIKEEEIHDAESSIR